MKHGQHEEDAGERKMIWIDKQKRIAQLNKYIGSEEDNAVRWYQYVNRMGELIHIVEVI
jgi:hypothetical protein